MDTLSAESSVAGSLASGGILAPEEIEALLQSLLSEHAGHRPRSLDGLISVQERRSEGAIEGSAIAISIDDQCVHPVTYSLRVRSAHELLENSQVTFGHSSPSGAQYGSPEHAQLAKALLSKTEKINWAYRFKREQTGWLRDDV